MVKLNRAVTHSFNGLTRLGLQIHPILYQKTGRSQHYIDIILGNTQRRFTNWKPYLTNTKSPHNLPFNPINHVTTDKCHKNKLELNKACLNNTTT